MDHFDLDVETVACAMYVYETEDSAAAYPWLSEKQSVRDSYRSLAKVAIRALDLSRVKRAEPVR